MALLTLIWLAIPVVTAFEDSVNRSDWLKSLALGGILAAATCFWFRRYFRDSWQGGFLESHVPDTLRAELYWSVMAPSVQDLLARESLTPEELARYVEQLPRSSHWVSAWLLRGLENDLVAELQSFAVPA